MPVSEDRQSRRGVPRMLGEKAGVFTWGGSRWRVFHGPGDSPLDLKPAERLRNQTSTSVSVPVMVAAHLMTRW